jgi:hypothetical protein
MSILRDKLTLPNTLIFLRSYMFKPKSFLIACGLSPLLFSWVSLPIQAQTTVFIPSVGTAGFNSGVSGQSGTSFSNPAQAQQALQSLPPNVVAALNAQASSILANLNGGTALQQTIASVLVAPSSINLSSLDRLSSQLAAFDTNSSFSSNVEGNNIVYVQNSNQVTITPPSGTAIILVAPPNAQNPSAALKAATLVLLAGGSTADAQLAAAIAGTGAQTIGDVIKLVSALSGLFAPSTVSGLPVTIPSASINNSSRLISLAINSDMLKIKSLETTKELMLAQDKTGAVRVNPQKLSEAIAAYNSILENSSPEAVVAMSKLDQFVVIGQTLRQLRSSAM